MKIFYLILLLLTAGCAKNPATNNLDFVIMGQQQEYEQGREFRKGVSNSKIYADESKQKYFNQLAQNIYSLGERPEKDLTFYLMKNDEANAYAVPGYIFLNRGLLPFIQDEAALTAIIAHEAAHINARHSLRSQSENFFVRWVLNSLPVKLGNAHKDEITNLSNLHYSRDFEAEADELSLQYLKKLDIPTVNAAQLHKSVLMYEQIMLKLANMNEASPVVKRTPELLRTHPLSEKRAEFIENKSERWYKLMQPYKQDQFYKQINGIAYGYNSINEKNSLILADSDIIKDKRSGVYGYKNIAYMKSQRLKLVMPEDYQARIMSQDPTGYNYKDKIKVDAYNISDDKNIYAIDIIADLLNMTFDDKKELLEKIKNNKNGKLDNDYFKNIEQKITDNEQIFRFEQAPSFWHRLLGSQTAYYYIYVKQLDDTELKDYFNHFRVVVLSTNIKKSFDESMLNDILFIKDNLVELTQKQAMAIKPLTIKTKQLKSTSSIKELSQENIPYIHFNQEWFRIFNGLYDEYNTEVESGTWLKLIPNPNKNI